MGVLSEHLHCQNCGEDCQHVLFETDGRVSAWCSHCCSEWTAGEREGAMEAAA